MLDEQYFGNTNNHPYLLKNFVNLRVDIDKEYGRRLYDKYELENTPAVLIANNDGSEWGRTIDSAYPVEEFHGKLDEIRKGKTVRSFKESLKNDPDNIDTIFNLAQKYEEQYRYNEAADLAKLLISHSNNTKTFIRKVDFVRLKTDYEMSYYEYGKFLLAYSAPEHTKDYAFEFPQSPLLGNVFGSYRDFYRNEKTAKKAFEVFEDLIKRFPNDKWLIVRYINHCVRNKINLDRCLELADYAYDNIGEKIYIGNPSNFEGNYAWLLINTGKDDKLKELSKRFIKDYPDRRTFLTTIANEYYSVSRYDLAFAYIEESIRVYPEDSENIYAFGRMAALSGQNLDRGIECLEEFITNISDNLKNYLPVAYWRLGLIYEHKKQPDRAKTEYEKALKLNPGFRQAKEALDKIRK